MIYYLTKFDSTVFELLQKITSANLCKSIHDTINFPLLFVLLNVKSVERKGEYYKILNTSRTKRAF